MNQKRSSSSQNFALVMIISLFFMWGFITCLNDILIQHLKGLFTLNYTKAMLIQFCFFSAYFIMSMPAGYLVSKLGYKKGIVTGLATAGFGCLMFIPAAAQASYTIFLIGLFILASGITLLQVAANPYVAILGNPETASSRLTLSQAFNSLGHTIAPYFGAIAILSNNVTDKAAAVQKPYIGLAIALMLISAIFAIIKLPTISEANAEKLKTKTSDISVWKNKKLTMGALGIFLYVGAEVAIGSLLVNFLNHITGGSISEATAAKYVSIYWGGAMVGRFLGSAIMVKIKPSLVLTINALIAAILVGTTALANPIIAIPAVLAIGVLNSIMFPTIFSLSVEGLGDQTSKGAGVLCMAIVGGAIIPVMQGVLADKIGIQAAYILPLLCYLYVAYLGTRHYKKVFISK